MLNPYRARNNARRLGFVTILGIGTKLAQSIPPHDEGADEANRVRRQRMEAGLSKLTQALLFISTASCVGMLALVNLDVVLKYTINQPIPGALEIVSYYFMPLIVFCSFAHIQRHRLNIEISLFTDLLPRPIATAIENVARLVALFYLAVFVWASTRTALDTTSVGTTTGVVGFDLVIWPPRWVVPISIGATFLWILLQLRGGRRKAAV